jgi:hypothetical protein
MRDKPQREQLFPTDEPVAADRLIGRTHDVRRIATSLETGQNLRVLSPRRTGKTTVCDAALSRLREKGWYAASVDLMQPAGAVGLAQELTRAVLSCRPQLRRALSDVRNAWERLGDRLRVQATLDLGDGVSIAFAQKATSSRPDETLEEALLLPQRVAEQDGRPVAVFLDELQELAAPAAPFGDSERLQARMRAIFQRSGQVSFLFAGSLDHSMRQIFRPEAPLGGFGGSYALSEIAPEEWERGLSERFESASVAVDGALLARIVELGSGHPRTTMLIAAESFGVTQEAGVDELDAAAVGLGWERACSHDAERCRVVIERMRQLRVAKGADLVLRLARALAAGDPPYAIHAHAQQVSRALEALGDIGVAEQVGRGSWRISDPILRAYLAVGSDT